MVEEKQKCHFGKHKCLCTRYTLRKDSFTLYQVHKRRRCTLHMYEQITVHPEFLYIFNFFYKKVYDVSFITEKSR